MIKVPRIVNGEPTTGDEWPWMVALLIEANGNDYQFCGASLIRSENPPIILTAAHCLDGLEATLDSYENFVYNMAADVGRTSVKNPSETGYQHLTWDFSNIKIHANYQTDPVATNDIALILADETSQTLPTPVNLWGSSSECCVRDDKLLALGYGLNETDDTSTLTLEKTVLKYIPADECNDWINKWLDSTYTEQVNYDFENYDWSDYTGQEAIIGPGMLCAFRNNSDTCQGDSGGPLLKGLTNTDPQIGLVSWGIGCADNIPGVYTDLAYFKDWIDAASGCMLYEYTGDEEYAESCNDLAGIEATTTTTKTSGARVYGVGSWVLVVMFAFVSLI
jgi:secreted trypsin-like serine protease